MSRAKYPWWGYAIHVLRLYRKAPERLTEREKEAVVQTVEDIKRLPEVRERMLILEDVHINGYLTLDGAALKANISYTTARRYSQHAIKQVGYHLGLLEKA